jgi:hypothetical protein
MQFTGGFNFGPVTGGGPHATNVIAAAVNANRSRVFKRSPF